MSGDTKPRLVLKIGTSTLTGGTKNISRGKIEDISRQILTLREEYDVIVVSSGAIAAARQFDKLNDPAELVTNKSSLSAIGQPKLMQMYIDAFSDHGLNAAQCLLTHHDLKSEDSRNNTESTLKDLMEHGYIPIVNENDTVSVEEIVLGDNDKLSALVAVLVGAQKLVIASDIDGLYDSNPNLNKDAKLIAEIKDIRDVKAFVQDTASELGTGGMESKIQALEICQGNNIEVIIVNGGVSFFLQKVLNKEIPHTIFKS
jgi:glutamate 5-kinase